MNGDQQGPGWVHGPDDTNQQRRAEDCKYCDPHFTDLKEQNDAAAATNNTLEHTKIMDQLTWHTRALVAIIVLLIAKDIFTIEDLKTIPIGSLMFQAQIVVDTFFRSMI